VSSVSSRSSVSNWVASRKYSRNDNIQKVASNVLCLCVCLSVCIQPLITEGYSEDDARRSQALFALANLAGKKERQEELVSAGLVRLLSHLTTCPLSSQVPPLFSLLTCPRVCVVCCVG